MNDRPVTFSRLGHLGGLGNQLFQVAGVVGVARTTGRRIALNPDWPYRPFFSCPDDWFDDGWTRAADAAYWWVKDIPRPWAVYAQRPAIWLDIIDEIRAAFAPSARAAAVLDALPQPEPLDVAVHVRRTDYACYPEHLPMLTERYYYDAHLRWVSGSWPHPDVPPFHVYGDDMDWAAENLNGGWRLSRYGNPDDPETDWADLLMMARYRHLVIANSSYSFWSAVLAGPDATVCHPSVWFGPAIGLPSPALPDWIEVPCK